MIYAAHVRNVFDAGRYITWASWDRVVSHNEFVAPTCPSPGSNLGRGLLRDSSMSKNGEVFRTIMRSPQYSKREQKNLLYVSVLVAFLLQYLFPFYILLCAAVFCLKQLMSRRKLGNVFCLQLLEGGEYEGEDLVPFYSPEDLLFVYPHQFYQVP